MKSSKKWHHSFRVYYEDTDAGGVVYYANYLKFAERARSEILRTAGLQPSTLATERGVVFVVSACSCRYLTAARLDDLLSVETSCLACGGARLKLAQKISIVGKDDYLGKEVTKEVTKEVAKEVAKKDANLKKSLTASATIEVSLALVSIRADEHMGKPRRLPEHIIKLFAPS